MSFLEKQRQGGRKALVIILVLALLGIIYVQVIDRAVPLPHAYLDALEQAVPEGLLDGSLIEAKKSGETYTVYVTNVEADGRRSTYTYEINENMQVSQKGMTMGYGGPNPVNTVLALLLGASLLSYTLFVAARRLLTPRCPHCRHDLRYEFLTLYAGGIGDQGEALPPILLRTTRCPSCTYTRNQVSVPSEFRPANFLLEALVPNPYINDKMVELQEQIKRESHMTGDEWQEMLRWFKDEYE